jgi:hypothetical protein
MEDTGDLGPGDSWDKALTALSKPQGTYGDHLINICPAIFEDPEARESWTSLIDIISLLKPEDCLSYNKIFNVGANVSTSKDMEVTAVAKVQACKNPLEKLLLFVEEKLKAEIPNMFIEDSGDIHRTDSDDYSPADDYDAILMQGAKALDLKNILKISFNTFARHLLEKTGAPDSLNPNEMLRHHIYAINQMRLQNEPQYSLAIRDTAVDVVMLAIDCVVSTPAEVNHQGNGGLLDKALYKLLTNEKFCAS